MQIFTKNVVVWMVLARVVTFVNDEEADPVEAPKGMRKGVHEYLGYGHR